MKKYPQQDKRQHFYASAIIALCYAILVGLIISNIYAGMLAGFGTAVGANFGKEYADWIYVGKKHWDWQDVFAGALGATAGILIYLSLALLFRFITR